MPFLIDEPIELICVEEEKPAQVYLVSEVVLASAREQSPAGPNSAARRDMR